MTLGLPNWMVGIGNWVGDTFFSGRDELAIAQRREKVREQERVERNAAFISLQIKCCARLKQTYVINGMITNLVELHGPKTQVLCWVDSLRLELRNKQIALINGNNGD